MGATEEIISQLKKVVLEVKQIETALSHEKLKNRRLEEQLQESQATYERLFKESDTKNRELTIQVEQFKTSLELQEVHSKERGTQVETLEILLKKTQAELSKYKTAWAGVLQREREAKEIITESDRRTRKMAELEARNQKLEALIKVESVQSDISDELKKFRQAKMDFLRKNQ